MKRNNKSERRLRAVLNMLTYILLFFAVAILLYTFKTECKRSLTKQENEPFRTRRRIEELKSRIDK